MKKLIVVFWFMISASLIAGCVANIGINPQVSVAKNNIGKGSKISVGLQDVRSSPVVTYRNASGTTAPLLVNKSAILDTSKTINKMIKSRGFIVAAPYQTQRGIIVRLTALQSTVTDPAVGIHRSTMAVFYVQATNHDKSYSQIYRGIINSSSLFKVNTVSFLRKQINLALSKALTKMADDRQLWQFLAK